MVYFYKQTCKFYLYLEEKENFYGKVDDRKKGETVETGRKVKLLTKFEDWCLFLNVGKGKVNLINYIERSATLTLAALK